MVLMVIIITIMARKTAPLLPKVKQQLKELGENIRLARLRRRLPATLVAERAGMNRSTLRAVERGESGATIGAYASVLMSLGLEKDLALIGRNDLLGRKLQDANLPVKSRAPRRRSPDKDTK